ncbi:MAG: hypothetical protein VX466_08620 [Myxococcota bacterium]|nr:hypothetical protein [Myxococcota bacterium]
MGDVAPAVHEHADFASDLAADLGELAGKLVREEPVGGQAALVEALDRADLAGLQAVGIAEDLDTGLLGSRQSVGEAVLGGEVPPGRRLIRVAVTSSARSRFRASEPMTR